MSFTALKVGELAKRTGLTIRTLHHYDAIGLVKPSLRTESGYRLYTAGDITRLHQVMSLRQLGLSLEDIGQCLDQPKFAPLELIEAQLAYLREQIAMQSRLCQRLEAIARHFQLAEEVSVDQFLQAIEVMTMLERHYTPEQLRQFDEIRAKTTPDEIRAIEEGWMALLGEIRASAELDPASPEAQALAQRWEQLQERTMSHYQAHPELQQAIADSYQQGTFEGNMLAPQASDFAFIERVKAARNPGN